MTRKEFFKIFLYALIAKALVIIMVLSPKFPAPLGIAEEDWVLSPLDNTTKIILIIVGVVLIQITLYVTHLRALFKKN